jgi:hypothetical protein
MDAYGICTVCFGWTRRGGGPTRSSSIDTVILVIYNNVNLTGRSSFLPSRPRHSPPLTFFFSCFHLYLGRVLFVFFPLPIAPIRVNSSLYPNKQCPPEQQRCADSAIALPALARWSWGCHPAFTPPPCLSTPLPSPQLTTPLVLAHLLFPRLIGKHRVSRPCRPCKLPPCWSGSMTPRSRIWPTISTITRSNPTLPYVPLHLMHNICRFM